MRNWTDFVKANKYYSSNLSKKIKGGAGGPEEQNEEGNSRIREIDRLIRRRIVEINTELLEDLQDLVQHGGDLPEETQESEYNNIMENAYEEILDTLEQIRHLLPLERQMLQSDYDVETESDDFSNALTDIIQYYAENNIPS